MGSIIREAAARGLHLGPERPGKGTTFEVYFPQVQSAPERVVGDAEVGITTGAESILVVEDEDTVLRLARSILKRAGYEVLTARNGAEALRIAGDPMQKIDLLMTGVIVPSMSGPALVDGIPSFRSDLPVLFTSGYTDDAIVHHGGLDAGTNLLEEPYSHHTLASTVRRVLASARKA